MVTDAVHAADGAQIVYHRMGSGPSVVIVHGAVATTAMYQPIAELLSRHYQVVLVERRGYGVSGDGQHPASFATQAMDLAAVLETLDGPSYIFGHSAGGLVTLHALSASAGHIRAVALYEPPAILAGARIQPILQQCRDLVQDGHNVDALVTFWSSLGEPDPSLRQLAAMFEDRAHGLIDDLECLSAMSTEPGRWSPGEIPLLLLTGGETDPYAKESIALLQEELSVHDTVTFAGQGHHPDNPEPVAAALHTFFSNH